MYQLDAASNPSRRALLHSGLLLKLCSRPDVVLNWIEVRAVRRPQVWQAIRVTTISEINALSERR